MSGANPVSAAIRERYESFFRAVSRRDIAAIESLISDDWTFTDSVGHTLSRTEYLAVIEAQRPGFTIRINRFEVRELGQDVALVLATWTAEIEDGEVGRLCATSRHSGVWMRVDGNWCSQHHHITTLPDSRLRGAL